MQKFLLPALLAVIASFPTQATPGGAERQQAFKTVLLHFEPMGMTIRGRTPYNKAAFAQQAAALKLAAAQAVSLFPANSIDGKSRAKPEIWSQPAKFKAARDNFITAVDKLDSAARNGDLDNIRKSYDSVASSCKACHDSFRGPKT
jgi:cytochrome c556